MPSALEDFISHRTFAIVGVSTDGRGFGARVYRNLKAKGCHVLAVNPKATEFEGDPCYPSLKELPEPVDGAVLVVPPQVTERVVRDAAEAGIKRVWMQEGAESEAAVEFARQSGMSVVEGHCVMVETDRLTPESGRIPH